MRTILTLLIFLIIGFIGSRGFVYRVTHRFPLSGVLVSGSEFFLLGILLGPQVMDLITADVLTELEPIIYLALGWIGLLFGIEMSWAHVSRVSRSVFKLLFFETLLMGVVLTPILFFALRYLFPAFSTVEHAVSATLLAVVAAISSPSVIALASQQLRSRGSFTNTIKIISALNALFPLIVFGLLYIVIRPHVFSALGGGFSGVLWWLLANLMGLVLGFVMVLFTRERSSDQEMLLLIVGTVLVVGGVCYFLELSSLYTAMIMGFVVGNFSRKKDQIFRELHLVEKTLFVVFLILVGAMLEFHPRMLVLIAAYVVLRLLFKYLISGAVVVRAFPQFAGAGRRAGFAMAAQGGMATAIALDYALAADNELARLVLSTVALAVVINDVVGLYLTRRALLESGEIVPPRPKKKEIPTEG